MKEIFEKLDDIKLYLNIGKSNSNQMSKKKRRVSRDSLVDLNKINFNKSSLNQDYLIENESSDSVSIIDVHINNDITLKIPSLTKIVKSILDENTIIVTDSVDNFPKESINKNGIGILISGIESWVIKNNIIYFLEHVPSFIKYKKNSNYSYENKLKVNYIRFFYIKDKYYAFVNIQNLEHIKVLGDYFFHPLKKLNPTLNSKKDKIEFYYAYDLLTLTKSFWYCVVLRNLPKGSTDQNLFQFCDNMTNGGIKYCLRPISINNIICSLVICTELEKAEELCYKLNNYELINKKIIKANLHPYTCKIRRNTNAKIFFSKNGYLYNDEIKTSETILTESKSCIELFAPEILEQFKSKFINKDIEQKKEEKKNKNITKKITKKNKINLNGSNIKILKNLKKILDLKNKKEKLKISKINSNKSTSYTESKSPIQENIFFANNINNNIENKKIYEDLLFPNKNHYSKDEMEFYTYNFPDKSFFVIMAKKQEHNLSSIYNQNIYKNNSLREFNYARIFNNFNNTIKKNNYLKNNFKKEDININNENETPFNEEYNNNQNYYIKEGLSINSEDETPFNEEYSYNKNYNIKEDISINSEDDTPYYEENKYKYPQTDKKDYYFKYKERENNYDNYYDNIKRNINPFNYCDTNFYEKKEIIKKSQSISLCEN